MQYGISSSALFGRMETDQALAFLRDSGKCDCVEVFFQWTSRRYKLGCF